MAVGGGLGKFDCRNSCAEENDGKITATANVAEANGLKTRQHLLNSPTRKRRCKYVSDFVGRVVRSVIRSLLSNRDIMRVAFSNTRC